MPQARARDSAEKLGHQRPGVSPAQWRDPDDAEALERGPDGRRHQRTVSGLRATDPLDRLPLDAEHWRAAMRLRADWECGSGARSGGPAVRVDRGQRGGADPVVAGLEARRRYQDAVAAVGVRLCGYLLPVVLAGYTVADLVQRMGGNAMAMQGRVIAALDRLVDHYAPPRETAILTDRATELADGLAGERLGRWRDLGRG